MRCHYEVLGVERQADMATIKAAYRKQALVWHPDKNIERQEYAKQQFQEIQQAYEVLSDPQERAWYDNHREHILCNAKKEGGKASSTEMANLYPYFATTVFRGFGDDANGFYSVYRGVFEQISAEESACIYDPEDIVNMPMFGDAASNYEQTVGPFYAYWTEFRTNCKYEWLFPFDPKDLKHRDHLRAAEREFQKLVTEERRKRNKLVRSLALFVRKRDPRFLAYKRAAEEQARLKREELAKKRMEFEIQRHKENKALLQSMPTPEYIADYNERLKALAQEYGESSDSADEVSDEEDSEINIAEVEDRYCYVCSKLFRTVATRKMHDESWVHLQRVEQLKQEMHAEAAELAYERAKEDEPEKDEDGNDVCRSSVSSSDSTGEEDKPAKKQKKKKSKPVKFVAEMREDEDAELELLGLKLTHNDEEDAVEEDDWSNGGKKSSKKSKNKRQQQQPTKKAEQEPAKQPPSTATKVLAENSAESTGNSELTCSTCKQEFPSKNKLFAHLKSSNHAAYLPKNAAKPAAKVGKNKKQK